MRSPWIDELTAVIPASLSPLRFWLGRELLERICRSTDRIHFRPFDQPGKECSMS
jgi:hypothetical protein